jgi:hypothetical protein
MPRAMKPINPGDRFGLWTVTASAEPRRFPSGQYQKQFLCQCDCGNSGLVTYSALTRGKSLSCGCRAERDYTGAVLGRLTVLRDTGKRRQGSTRIYAVRCDECGTERENSYSEALRNGQKRCTCLLTKSEVAALGGHKHGMAGTPEWNAWFNMRQRCNYIEHTSYKNYGGRGTRVAAEWDNDRDGFQLFFEHVGPRPGGHSLDRIDPHGNYEPGNVRWATKDLQEANKRPVLDATEIPYLYYCRKTGKFYRDVTDELPPFVVNGLRTKYGIVDATAKNDV